MAQTSPTAAEKYAADEQRHGPATLRHHDHRLSLFQLAKVVHVRRRNRDAVKRRLPAAIVRLAPGIAPLRRLRRPMFVVSHALFPYFSKFIAIDLGFCKRGSESRSKALFCLRTSPRSWKSRFFKPDSASTIPRRSSRLSIRRQFHTCGAQPLQALVELGSLVLEHRLLSRTMASRSSRVAAPRRCNFTYTGCPRSTGRFPKRIDEVQLSHIRLRERADAARIARQFGKNPHLS